MSTSNAPEPGELAYVLWTYPSRSERFVEREIAALARRGLPLTAIVVGPVPEREEVADEETAAASIVRVGAPPTFALAGAALRGVLSRPAFALGLVLGLVDAVRCGAGLRRSLWMVALAARAATLLVRVDPRRVHAQFGSLPATFALVLSRALRCRFSFSAHARDLWLAPRELARKARRADFVACCTQAGLEHLHAHGAPRLALVRHGLVLDRWRMRTSAPTAPPVVLAVGRLEEKKGFDVLLEACAILASRGVELRCEIAGDGPLRGSLERRRDGLGVGDRVRFLGWLGREELRSHYDAAQVLAVPSRVAADGDRDGVPNVVLEAMARGLPVVATTAGATAEVVDEVRVPPGDAEALARGLERVLVDDDLAGRLARRGRRRIEADFESDVLAARLEELLRRRGREVARERAAGG